MGEVQCPQCGRTDKQNKKGFTTADAGLLRQGCGKSVRNE